MNGGRQLVGGKVGKGRFDRVGAAGMIVEEADRIGINFY